MGDEYNEVMERQKTLLAKLKYDIENRGEAKLAERMQVRNATHKSWRQMKGVQRIMYEVNHPGNFPFVVGLGVVGLMGYSMYSAAYDSEKMKKESDYYQRYHAKSNHH